MSYFVQTLKYSFVSLSALSAAACCHYGAKGGEPVAPTALGFDEPMEFGADGLTSPVSLEVVPNGSGGVDFRCAGAFADAACNLDFRKGRPLGKTVQIEFDLRGENASRSCLFAEGRRRDLHR